ncbi:MAG: carcinine hydrolase/isopenicillin-N N-acyltransferase family protein, partial [bacterium]
HDLLSRNYDFSLGNIKLQPCEKDELPVCSRPVIFEIYPDTGYASLYIADLEIFGGVIDGINSQGLSVAVLTDGLVYEGYKPEPSYEVGLYELLIMRYLLDNCKNVQEAKKALLYLKQYYISAPLHYIIADSQGRSFIFEFSRQRNQTFIIDNNGIQCITTHLISNHDTSNVGSVKNLEKLKSMTSAKDKFTLEEIKEINNTVSPKMTYHPLYVPSRTLWHSMYDLDAKTLQVKFYLGETKNPKNKNKIITHYTKYLEFSLDE